MNGVGYDLYFAMCILQNIVIFVMSTLQFLLIFVMSTLQKCGNLFGWLCN